VLEGEKGRETHLVQIGTQTVNKKRKKEKLEANRYELMRVYSEL